MKKVVHFEVHFVILYSKTELLSIITQSFLFACLFVGVHESIDFIHDSIRVIAIQYKARHVRCIHIVSAGIEKRMDCGFKHIQ